MDTKQAGCRDSHADEMQSMQILKAIKGPQGYFDQLFLSQEELDWMRQQVRLQWQARILELHPQLVTVLSQYDLPCYHQLLIDYPQLEHRRLWNKNSRIFTPAVVEHIRQMPFFRKLEAELGPVKIADEERLYPEEIYWRLARPGVAEDVGPMHADSWFWALGHGRIPPGYVRVKIWIPLYLDPGLNGLRFVAGSHRQAWPYIGIERDGLVKPQIQVSDDELDITPFAGQPGQAILFNDDLLHGGLVGGQQSRVSVEWTLFVEKSCYESAKRGVM